VVVPAPLVPAAVPDRLDHQAAAVPLVRPVALDLAVPREVPGQADHRVAAVVPAAAVPLVPAAVPDRPEAAVPAVRLGLCPG